MTYLSKITLSLALIGGCCTLYAGWMDEAKTWLQKQGVSLPEVSARGYGRSEEARETLKRRMDPRARVGHWNEVIRAFKRCGPADNSETMQWAQRNLERAEKAERHPILPRTYRK